MKLFSVLAVYGASASACEDGIHAHETRCDAFYQCANGHRYEDQSCPEGLLYNANTEQCDWPENVTCPDVECADGIYPHEDNCNQFYQCANGHRYEDQDCPEGLLYNEANKQCDWPDNVKCIEDVDQTKWQCYKDCVGDKWWNMIQASKCSYQCSDWSKKVSKKSVKSEECADGIYAHETNCNQFYQCANGHRYEDQSCPDGLFFNSDKDYCDYPDNVTCPEPEPEAPAEEKCKRGEVMAHDSDCKKYYQCIGFGFKIPRNCPKGKIFYKKAGECDWVWKPWVRC